MTARLQKKKRSFPLTRMMNSLLMRFPRTFVEDQHVLLVRRVLQSLRQLCNHYFRTLRSSSWSVLVPFRSHPLLRQGLEIVNAFWICGLVQILLLFQSFRIFCSGFATKTLNESSENDSLSLSIPAISLETIRILSMNLREFGLLVPNSSWI